MIQYPYCHVSTTYPKTEELPSVYKAHFTCLHKLGRYGFLV